MRFNMPNQRDGHGSLKAIGEDCIAPTMTATDAKLE